MSNLSNPRPNINQKDCAVNHSTGKIRVCLYCGKGFIRKNPYQDFCNLTCQERYFAKTYKK